MLSAVWPWLFLVLLLITCFVIYRKLKSKKFKATPLSLEESTLLAIEQLEKEHLWEKGLLKSYYVALSFIIRDYLSQRFAINLLEKTTNETQLLLKQIKMDRVISEKIEIILNESDMVKFAQSQPDESAMKKIADIARQIVLSTRPIEENHAE
jgi:hypothetical protein